LQLTDANNDVSNTVRELQRQWNGHDVRDCDRGAVLVGGCQLHAQHSIPIGEVGVNAHPNGEIVVHRKNVWALHDFDTFDCCW
jgi:hypothetical protein